MNDGLDRNEKKMLAISPNKGVKSKALSKKSGMHKHTGSPCSICGKSAPPMSATLRAASQGRD